MGSEPRVSSIDNAGHEENASGTHNAFGDFFSKTPIHNAWGR